MDGQMAGPQPDQPGKSGSPKSGSPKSGPPRPERRIDADDDFARLHERGKLHRIERGPESEPYDIHTDVIRAPALPGEVAALPTVDRAIDVVAADLLVQALNCIRTFGDFHLALSGGRSPVPLYERLMYDPNYRSLPWQKTHLWIVDEPRVPFTDPRSSFRLIRETIVDHSDIPPQQVHPIFPIGDAPDEAYEAVLREVLAWREKGQDRLDFVLLGVGEDGSTAGLAPHTRLLNSMRGDARQLVGVARAPEVAEPGRVTMTPALINASRFVAVLAFGAEKRAAVARIAGGHEPTEALPLKAIRPTGGTLKWYLDAAAAGATAPEA